MRRLIHVWMLIGLVVAGLLVPAAPAKGQVGRSALLLCRDLAFSVEEDFLTQGPKPPDGNTVISDGDLLGPNCVVCARNRELLQIFQVALDLGLDAVDVIDTERYLVAFSTELDSPNAGQFTAGDLLVTNGAVIPNVALLFKFNLPRADLGLDGLQFIGDLRSIIAFLDYVSKVTRADWLDRPEMLAGTLAQFGVDIWFSTEGTAPRPEAPGFLDGDVLSARTGSIVASNSTLLPPSVPAGIPQRGVDFGLDALAADRSGNKESIQFSTEILYSGELSFTDGDVLKFGNGVVRTNGDLVNCFEPKANFLGLDALSINFQQKSQVTYQASAARARALPWGVAGHSLAVSPDEWGASASANAAQPVARHEPARALGVGMQESRQASSMVPCTELAFSTEEDFVTQGPVPPDGNPIISDGDLLGPNCVICARNRELLQIFQVTLDLGLDAADVIDAERYLVAFSTELDSPNLGQFTAGDLLVTNGAIIPNAALLFRFSLPQADFGLDTVHFIGDLRSIAAFLDYASRVKRAQWLERPELLSDLLGQYGIDIWLSTEGTMLRAGAPGFLDGDLLSARTGTIVAANTTLLPPTVPAGIPQRGVDFGLDAVTADRSGKTESIHFSTEILYQGQPAFTDGDVLLFGNGVLANNEELIACFEPRAQFLGLDVLAMPSLGREPTPTPTVTRRPTLTDTPTPTLSPYPTRTHTPTPTLTRYPTLTDTPTPTLTRYPVLTDTPTPTLSPWPTRTHTPTPTLTRYPTLTHTPTPTVTRWPTATRTPILTPTATPPKEPPVDFPPYDKPYAQEEIKIFPYPVQADVPTEICVTIVNKSTTAQVVTVQFDISPLGIGLDFLPIPAAGNPQQVTVPPNSRIEVCIKWVPTPQDVGHRCIQVTIRQPGWEPLRSQKNLDIVEPLVPGQEHTLVIPVSNPLPTVADVQMRVSNHCPGWTAYVQPELLPGMGDGGMTQREIREVMLHVVPPTTAKLGSGCYIDVEAWALLQPAAVLIGGIRKVDFPPLQPHHPADPPFAEREIEIDPYPVVVGKRTQVCAVLYNPTDQPQTVTVEFSMADFGIGVPFTPIPHPDNPQTVTIPAHGSLKVCIYFVPTHPGHICIQIRISKQGYVDVISQKNLDVVEPLWPGETDTLQFPVGNPLDHSADIEIEIVSNCPGWTVRADPARLEDVAPGEVRIVRLYVTPQQGVTLGTECTVDVIAWADSQMIGGIRKIDRPPVPHPPRDPPYAEREIEVRPFPLEVGVPTNICAVLDNKSERPQTVAVEFSMADFTIGVPFQHIPAPGNPRTVTIPPQSTVKACIQWTPLTPGHKCFQIRISQQGYEDIISQKNLDVGEYLRPGKEDQLLIAVGNPKNFIADIQLVVSSGCPEWQASVDPEILRNVPPGGVRNVVLKVVPPAAGATLGSGCYIDVEAYINGELISGIRKLDLPPVRPPLGEPPYAEREITIIPDPPVVGQPAEVCATLYNYTGLAQTVDLTLYVADFGIGLPFTAIGTLADVVIPAHGTIQRCLTWTPLPGSQSRCLQIRIQQEGYRDIISQRNIKLARLPSTVQLPLRYEFCVSNPTNTPQLVQLNTAEIGLPEGWKAVLDWEEALLDPGEIRCNALTITANGLLASAMALSKEMLPGDAHLVAVEAFINDELIGGVQFEFEVAEYKLYLPIVLKRYP